MRSRKQLGALIGACLIFSVVDRAAAWLAIDTSAAAALLSPAGASLEALAIALAFLLARLGLALVFCATLAWLASQSVRSLFEHRARRKGRLAGLARRRRTRPKPTPPGAWSEL